MGGLSLKFKTEARSAKLLNFNERTTTRFLCCLYTVPTTPICYCPREVAVVGRNKVEHACALHTL
jgi:hypothetical protein